MTLTITTLISAIKRHLSIIGKRLYTKEGKNLFSDITLSSAEDTNILTQYINASAQDIEAVLKQFITASTYSTATIEMTIANTRGDSDFQTRVQNMSESYVTLNSVGEYLSMLHPDLAQKYYRDAQQRIEMLVAYVYYKKPPIPQSETLSFTDPTANFSNTTVPSDGTEPSGVTPVDPNEPEEPSDPDNPDEPQDPQDL